MKLKVTKSNPEGGEDDTPKKKVKLKVGKKLDTQYGIYSGIVDDKGKTNREPTETEAIVNMANYMKNNNPPESTNPSNVYRQKFSHIGVVYNRKKKQDTA